MCCFQWFVFCKQKGMHTWVLLDESKEYACDQRIKDGRPCAVLALRLLRRRANPKIAPNSKSPPRTKMPLRTDVEMPDPLPVSFDAQGAYETLLISSKGCRGVLISAMASTEHHKHFGRRKCAPRYTT